MKNNIRPFLNSKPKIAPTAYIDPAAVVIGEVIIGEESSIWPCTVIRGDVNSIAIGNMTNIQDLSILHVGHKSVKRPEGYPLVIGDCVTIGHNVSLHGCTIENETLIGSGSIVLDGAIVKKHVLLGAGSLVPPNKILESGYLYMGSPAKKVRALTQDEINFFRKSAENYRNYAKNHQASLDDLSS